MSLRRAIALLPDDRATARAVREVVSFFHAHPHESVDSRRIARATGLDTDRVEPVVEALAQGLVIDCGDDPRLGSCSFEPDMMLELEVGRFLRAGDSASSKAQHHVNRFRGRQGSH